MDNPSESTDSLSRIGFVNTLTNTLVNLPHNRSLVTAVFGPWGSGKSWILEHLDTNLKTASKEVTVCRFAPWEMKSQDQILAEFFTTIAQVLPQGEKHKNLESLWEQLEQITIVGSLGAATIANALTLGGASNEAAAIALASTAVLGSFSKLVGNAKKSSAKSPSLSSIKDALAVELQKKLDHPIVVLIDDMDRLTDGEIQMIIRLLNTTANLPQIHYVIFGDRKQIAAALDPICGNEGDRYLEKIIHHLIQVPEPSKTHIQMRLADGLKIIASSSHADFDPRDKKFQNYWEEFISYRVLNLRDTHRLLRTVSFHASALARNGKLEVDLLDLLGIDFLKVFDPESYQSLANGPLIQHMLKGWESAIKENQDDIWLIDLIKKSTLPTVAIAGAIISLFPNSSKAMKNHLESQQLTVLCYRNNSELLSPLSIGKTDKTYLYFQLELAAGDIPEIHFQSFLDASHDTSRLGQMMLNAQERHWFPQLFYRLRTLPEAILKQTNITNILQAVSQISDSLEDNELRSAFDLTDSLIEAIEPSERIALINNIILSPHDVTLSLLLIEYLRHTADCKYQPGMEASTFIPKLESKAIEQLTDSCLPNVTRRFIMNFFMKDDYEALRAYRMAHALGPKRTQKILQEDVGKMSGKQTWKLLESVAISVSPQYRISWMEDGSEDSNFVEPLRKRLHQFASDDFWKKFVTQSNAPTDLSKRLVQCLQTHYNIQKKETFDQQ